MATYWPALGPSRYPAAARCCYLHSSRRADREMLSANHRRSSELLQGATIEASTIWATSSVRLQPSEPGEICDAYLRISLQQMRKSFRALWVRRRAREIASTLSQVQLQTSATRARRLLCQDLKEELMNELPANYQRVGLTILCPALSALAG